VVLSGHGSIDCGLAAVDCAQLISLLLRPTESIGSKHYARNENKMYIGKRLPELFWRGHVPDSIIEVSETMCRICTAGLNAVTEMDPSDNDNQKGRGRNDSECHHARCHPRQ
jgi:hypothetical protein